MELRKQKIYKTVFEIACMELLKSNCEAQFTNAGVTYEKRQDKFVVDIPYFDETITLKIPEFSPENPPNPLFPEQNHFGTGLKGLNPPSPPLIKGGNWGGLFSFKSSKQANVTLVTKIIILHYINTATGALPGIDKISYEDIPGLGGYLPVFEKRTTRPLLFAFGFDRHAFLETGTAMGGKKEDYGDASFTLYALPRVPITFILWEGDEEFPSSLKILFDPSITGYLPLEDITVISKLASVRIIKEARLRYTG